MFKMTALHILFASLHIYQLIYFAGRLLLPAWNILQDFNGSEPSTEVM
jgi:hypothetical protein